MVPVQPTLLVSFKAEADHVLDLRNPKIQAALQITTEQLMSIDARADANEAGKLTPLQRIGVAAYKSGRFSGVLVPSRFADAVPEFCFNFLPSEVKPRVQDLEGMLRKISFAQVT